jgi:hypothetical protein
MPVQQDGAAFTPMLDRPVQRPPAGTLTGMFLASTSPMPVFPVLRRRNALGCH